MLVTVEKAVAIAMVKKVKENAIAMVKKVKENVTAMETKVKENVTAMGQGKNVVKTNDRIEVASCKM